MEFLTMEICPNCGKHNFACECQKVPGGNWDDLLSAVLDTINQTPLKRSTYWVHGELHRSVSYDISKLRERLKTILTS